MSMTVDTLAVWLGGEVIGNGDLVIDRAQSLTAAGSQAVTFFVGDANVSSLKKTAATAVLVSRQSRSQVTVASQVGAWILVDDPRESFLKVAARFAPRRARAEVGISPHAFVSATAQIGRHTNIHPGAYVGLAVVIGDRCDIHPGAVVGRGCRLGDDTVLHPHAVLYDDILLGSRVIIHAGAVIGADGFGYRTVGGRHERVPHFGTVRIEDDVEIGAGTTIDRAMVDQTVIGQGTKVDNLVMIGHNCVIGRHNLFASQVGLAGSVTTGDYVVCAGQVGIADHVRLGARSVLGAKAGVHKDVPEGERQIGSPALREADCFRVFMVQTKLPEMRRRLRELESQVEELSARLQRVALEQEATLVVQNSAALERPALQAIAPVADRISIETVRTKKPTHDVQPSRDDQTNEADQQAAA